MMDKRDRILRAINAGRHKHANKGFGSWDKERFNAFVKKRQRDAKGKFIKTRPVEDTSRVRHNVQGHQEDTKEED